MVHSNAVSAYGKCIDRNKYKHIVKFSSNEYYTRIGSNKGKTPEHNQAKHTKHPHSLEWHNSTITIVFPSTHLTGKFPRFRAVQIFKVCSMCPIHAHPLNGADDFEARANLYQLDVFNLCATLSFRCGLCGVL